ncbi:hypothetical protein ARMSODRAFT_979036 [Armillaria solidipes]|uniref:Uncharacterized protein n=1 Tax=Armillaria solidipes TaxID=1076256 RepID=A0A2H3BKW8_9AGAR|nr:hypothetical protein ARMSODRAFT_979036 [Armillaria solidipes]
MAVRMSEKDRTSRRALSHLIHAKVVEIKVHRWANELQKCRLKELRVKGAPKWQGDGHVLIQPFRSAVPRKITEGSGQLEGSLREDPNNQAETATNTKLAGPQTPSVRFRVPVKIVTTRRGGWRRSFPSCPRCVEKAAEAGNLLVQGSLCQRYRANSSLLTGHE